MGIITVGQREEMLRTFREDAKAALKMYESTDLYAISHQGDVDEVKLAVDCMVDAVKGAIPAALAPRINKYISCTSTGEEGVITLININIQNKLKDARKFIFKSSFSTDASVREQIEGFLLAIFEELFIDNMIVSNLVIVNEVIANAVAKAGVGYTVSVVSPLQLAGKKLVEFTDDDVVFVVDYDKAFELGNYVIFLDADPSEEDMSGYTAEDYEAAFEAIVKEFASCQTTTELVAEKGTEIISVITEIRKSVKPSTLIKKVYRRDASKMKGSVEGLAYYLDGTTFAVINKTADGMTVALQPINLDTLERVDVDVVSKLA